MSGKAKRGFLRLLKNTLNRLTSRLARIGHGPFSLVRHEIDRIEPCAVEAGLAAYGNPRAFVLRLLHRHEFRVLHEATEAD